MLDVFVLITSGILNNECRFIIPVRLSLISNVAFEGINELLFNYFLQTFSYLLWWWQPRQSAASILRRLRPLWWDNRSTLVLISRVVHLNQLPHWVRDREERVRQLKVVYCCIGHQRNMLLSMRVVSLLSELVLWTKLAEGKDGLSEGILGWVIFVQLAANACSLVPWRPLNWGESLLAKTPLRVGEISKALPLRQRSPRLSLHRWPSGTLLRELSIHIVIRSRSLYKCSIHRFSILFLVFLPIKLLLLIIILTLIDHIAAATLIQKVSHFWHLSLRHL